MSLLPAGGRGTGARNAALGNPDAGAPLRSGRRDWGERLAAGLPLVALAVFAGLAPLLPFIDWKVDATLVAGLLLILGAYVRVRTGRSVGRTRLDAPVIAFLLVAGLATVFSVNRFLSFFPSRSRGEGLLVSLAYGVMALAAARLSRRQAGALIAVALVGAGLLSAVALAQYYGMDPNAWVRYHPGTPGQYFELERFGFRVDLPPGVPANLFGPRSYGTLGNPVFLGGYVTLLLPLALALAVQTRGRRWWGPAAASTLLYAALVGSQTRAAWVACAGAAILLLVLVPRSAQVYRRLVILALLFVLVTVVMVRTNPHVWLAGRLRSTADPQAHALQVRLYFWKHTIPLILQRPLFGWGFSALLGRFPDLGSPEYLRLIGPVVPVIDNPHNEFLSVAFSTGLAGLSAYVWIWLVVLISLYTALRRRPASPLAPGLAAGMAAYALWLQLAWNHIGPAQVFWTLAGVAVALGRAGGDPWG